ncbi:MAG: hypothetical protein QM699_03280 [Amaricoccus sp.]
MRRSGGHPRPPPAGGFVFTGDAARTRLDAEAGLDILATRGFDLRLSVAA